MSPKQSINEIIKFPHRDFASINLDINLLKERLELFVKAIFLYPKLNLTYQIEPIQQLIREFNALGMDDLEKKLNSHPTLLQRLKNQNAFDSDAHFNNYLNNVNQNITSEQHPVIQIDNLQQQLFIHNKLKNSQQVLNLNSQYLAKVENFEKRLKGNPQILKPHLNKVANDFLEIIGNLDSSNINNQFFAKLAKDMNLLAGDALPIDIKQISSREQFEAAFIKKYIDDYSPELINELNALIFINSPEYQNVFMMDGVIKFQEVLKAKLQNNEFLEFNSLGRLNFIPKIQEENKNHIKQLKTDLEAWMIHSRDNLIYVSKNIKKEADVLINVIDEEEKEIKSIKTILKEIRALVKKYDAQFVNSDPESLEKLKTIMQYLSENQNVIYLSEGLLDYIEEIKTRITNADNNKKPVHDKLFQKTDITPENKPSAAKSTFSSLFNFFQTGPTDTKDKDTKEISQRRKTF